MKKYKGFIAGMLTMALVVVLSGTAIATTGKVQREIEYRDIKVSLDGKVLDLKDAQGNTVEPFMFAGTNYVPARALAEALNLNVAWDGSTSTIVLTSKQPEKEPPAETLERKDLLFSREHVRVYALGISVSDDGGQDVRFLVENESDYDVRISVRDIQISGKQSYVKVTGEFSCPAIDPGDQGEAVLHFSKEELAEKNADEFKIIQLRFTGGAKYEGGWVGLFETGVYSIVR